MKKYINLLASNKNIRILAITQMISSFGAIFSFTGIYTLLVGFDAPTWAISLTSAMAFIPGIILAPFTGVIVDRFAPYRLLMGFMAVETFSVLLLIPINSMGWFWFLQSVIFLRMAVASVQFGAQMSLLPQLLNADELKLANEIYSVIWAISFAAGMGLSGVYVHYFGAVSSFVFDFVLLLAGLFILSKLEISHIKARNAENNALAMINGGLKYIISSPTLIKLILLHSVIGVTTYDAIIALLAKTEYASVLSTPLVIGLTNMSRAFALVIGPIMLSKFMNNSTLFWAFVAQGVALVAWAFLKADFFAGFVGMFLAGFCISSIWAYLFTLIQRHTQKEFYGRVTAYVSMLSRTVSALTAFMVGFLFDLGMSLQIIICLMGVVFFIASLFYKIFVFKDLK